MSNRRPTNSFLPGNKAAVGHGPSKVLHLRDIAKEILKEPLGESTVEREKWKKYLRDDDPRIGMAALVRLSEYAYGRPRETVELTGADGKDLFGDAEQRKVMLAHLEALVGQVRAGADPEPEPDPKGGVN